MYIRYAVYFTPKPGSALARFGASWLGWDSASGMACVHPEIDGIDVARMTETPRKYGFHGTVKPPFRLAEGATVAALNAAFEAVCADEMAVKVGPLQLARLGRFLALVPAGDAPALTALAARVVRDLDPFRAPLSEDELVRRRKSRLTGEQDENLVRWGYPYVMNAFRFHLTLTGPLKPAQAAVAQEVLTGLTADLRAEPCIVDALTLMGEDAEGRFHQLRRVDLDRRQA